MTNKKFYTYAKMVRGLGELKGPSLPLMDPLWAPLGAPKVHRFIAKMQLMRF